MPKLIIIIFFTSIALSASKSYHMPTVAFKIKIVKITHGSTHGGTAWESSWSSNYEITNEITAANNNILTKLSSNYSLIFSQMLSFSSFSNSFGPYFANLLLASSVVKPLKLIYRYTSIDLSELHQLPYQQIINGMAKSSRFLPY